MAGRFYFEDGSDGSQHQTCLGVLARYDRPVADLSDYDALLTRPSKVAVH